MAALFHSFFSFFFFFFFLFLLASLCSESSPQSLLGEPVHCFLTGGSGVVSGIRPFLDGISSLFQGVSFVEVSLGVAAFPRVLNAMGAIGSTFSSMPWGVASHDQLS